MTLNQLRYFCAVCKYQNITRAAEAIHISQPSLSNSIIALEKELDITLLYRLSNGILPTEAGTILLEYAERILAENDELTAKILSLETSNQTLTLGVAPMNASLILPGLLKEYSRNFPNIEVKLHENGSLTNIALVSDGTLDAAIITSISDIPDNLCGYLLGSYAIQLFISSSNAVAKNDSVKLADLRDLPIVFLAQDSFVSHYVTELFDLESIRPKVLLRTNQIEVIKRLVENDTAITFLAEGILHSDDRIRSIPIDETKKVSLYLIWNKNQVSSVIRKLVAVAKEITDRI